VTVDSDPDVNPDVNPDVDPDQNSDVDSETGRPAAALAGIRVCDLSGQLAGAGATRYLAAFGAEVIRVEDPTNKGGWDIVRGAPPFVDDRRGIDLGGGFNNHNVGKWGVTLNLRTGEGKKMLSDLIRISDVVTENFAAGVFARMGFGYDELCALRPDIIYVSNCGFGQTGPYRSYKTWGPIVQACAGLTFNSALAGHEPAGWGYSYMDHMGANYMALAVLAAIIHRNRTGEGQWVDISCTETAATLTGTDILDHGVNRRPPRRPGSVDSNRSAQPPMAPHGIFPAAGGDAWVAIACRDDAEWAACRTVIGEEWAGAERFAQLAGRLANQDELDRNVGEWTCRRDRHEVAQLLVSAGVPAAAVAMPEDRIDHDMVTADWGLWPTVRHSLMGEVKVEGLPVHLSRTDWVVERGAPCLGEHNEKILGGLLGIAPDELADLAERGVV
jgi:crotonobetainyl-CoA:carnitine CoA-transferase CaiB-like acyl-CoA transferase